MTCSAGLPFCPCVVSIEICAPALPLPKLIVTSSGEPEELPWPRLTMISGVDPPEALVPDAPPKLMTSSGTPEVPEPFAVAPVDADELMAGSVSGC